MTILIYKKNTRSIELRVFVERYTVLSSIQVLQSFDQVVSCKRNWVLAILQKPEYHKLVIWKGNLQPAQSYDQAHWAVTGASSAISAASSCSRCRTFLCGFSLYLHHFEIHYILCVNFCYILNVFFVFIFRMEVFVDKFGGYILYTAVCYLLLFQWNWISPHHLTMLRMWK